MQIPLLRRANEFINGMVPGISRTLGTASVDTAPVEIFCDFDGTISTCDVTDRLLEELADPKWKDVETTWENGEIGSRECMAQQVALIRGGWKAMQGVLDSIELEPSFKPFVKWCRDHNISLHVVSDGLDKVISCLFEREGIKVSSIVANRLVESVDGNFSLQFPYSVQNAFCTSGVCKCKFLAEVKSTKPMKIVIGDGRSDFCWANEADLVFAKSQLLEYCKEKHLHYTTLEDFDGVADYIERNLIKVPVAARTPATEHMDSLPSFGLQSA